MKTARRSSRSMSATLGGLLPRHRTNGPGRGRRPAPHGENGVRVKQCRKRVFRPGFRRAGPFYQGMAEVDGGREDPISSRSRIIAAAVRLTCAHGWSKVTMGRLAAEAGVSRQTVYNAVGSREDLAEAMVLTESAGFVFSIVEGFDAYPDDLPAGIHAAL